VAAGRGVTTLQVEATATPADPIVFTGTSAAALRRGTGRTSPMARLKRLRTAAGTSAAMSAGESGINRFFDAIGAFAGRFARRRPPEFRARRTLKALAGASATLGAKAGVERSTLAPNLLSSGTSEECKMDIVRIVVAILLPPVGVFLQVGFGGHFWLNILLTLLGYIPGIVHAVWIIARR
jgi:uncharacterized membrane protein YqaE (UPF0057 family)